MIIKKLLAGAHEVYSRRLPSSGDRGGRGTPRVQVEWRTQAAPPGGPKLRCILEAAAELDWRVEAKAALGE